MRHLITVGRIEATGGCYWRCSCGVESARSDLSWSRAHKGAQAHEQREASLPSYEVILLLATLKWFCIVLAMVVPFLVGHHYGTQAMLWAFGAEAIATCACVLDHMQSLIDQRADRMVDAD